MKKKMRRLLFVILAAITALAMSAPAFAATIKISNGHKGQTYTAYKLLNYDTKTESGETKITSYYLTETEYDAGNNNGLGKFLEDAGITFVKDGSKYYVNKVNDDDEFISFLKTHVKTTPGVESVKLESKSVTPSADGATQIDGLTAGYYFVNSTTGTAIMLDNDTNASFKDKNDVNLNKTVTGGDATEPTHNNSADVGDELTYEAVITAQPGAENLTFIDNLSDGLALVGNAPTSVQYKNSAGEWTALDTGNYSVSYFNDTDKTEKVGVPEETASNEIFNIRIDFTKNFLDNIKVSDYQIKITYKATITEKAKTLDEVTNDATLHYGHQNGTVTSKTTTKLFGFKLKKVDGGNSNAALKDVEFKLTNGNNKYYVGYDNDNNTPIWGEDGNDAILKTDADGYIYVHGLEAGTYTLKETKALNGYVTIKDITIKIEKDNDGYTFTASGPDTNDMVITGTSPANNSDGALIELMVKNYKKGEVPTTGGTGTTMLYIIGAIIVAGAAVTLVMRRRRQNAE